MHPGMMIAYYRYAVAAGLSITIGIRYLARRRLMPYHEAAAGITWEMFPAGLQTLTLAFLRGVGGGFLAVGLAVAVLLGFPFRAGDGWARWAIPIIGVTAGLPTLLGVYHIRTRTPARPPWGFAVLAVALFIVGAVATVVASNP